MLDRDLSQIYEVKPFRLREQVKRNRGRFPEDFMFRLTEDEAKRMVSQNAIPSRKYLGGHLPYVFTEHGAVMLASVLRSPVAVAASIEIVRAFNRMRRMAAANREVALKLLEHEDKLGAHDAQIKNLFAIIRWFLEPPQEPSHRIGRA